MDADFLLPGAIQQNMQFILGNRTDRRIQVNLVMLGDCLNHLPVITALIARAVPLHGGDCAVIH